MQQVYTALTIGPIVPSLALARKTREFWGASYLFSHIMEKSVERLLKEKEKHDFEIILPVVAAKTGDHGHGDGNNSTGHVGVYPDRLFIRSENGVLDIVQNAVDDALEQVGTHLSKAGGEDCLRYFRRYFKTYIVEGEYRERKLPEEDGKDNPLRQFSDFLSSCELQEKYMAEDPECFVEFLENINRTGLYKSAFGNGHFPSIPEISTRELDLPEEWFGEDEEKISDKISEVYEKEEQSLVEDKKKKEDCRLFGKLMLPHKYIALVQADGDNVGKLAGMILDNHPGKLAIFSESLSNFAFGATALIKKKGGEPVYAGGDDLLFFAPVLYNGSGIIQLINEIDKMFDERVTNNEKLKDVFKEAGLKPSMSFGLSVTYNKFPMNKAMESARRLLFENAKGKKDKNALAMTVQMHSGQGYSAVWSKSSLSYKDHFMPMLKAGAENVISSVIYNLELHKPLLKSIIGDKERLDSFFENTYNEDFHKENRPFIEHVRDMLFQTFQEMETENKEKALDKTLSNVYAALRFVKFLKTMSHE